jgi:organic hydroperoxide reductase OsmC/OhrA
MADAHEFETGIVWDGNRGDGTASYRTYGREYRVQVAGKPDIAGSADPAFRGDAARHNPEDLFVAAIASCHMLTYLALCATRGVRVLAYEDTARGRLVLERSGGGRFEAVTLRPRVTVADAASVGLAQELHEAAHALCFVGNSCSVPIRHEATVEVG